ncbi:3-deoxy-manno-octulosonate cytidylyltransferase [Helicobacter turcicus]|uniref:3-deoxy-manno-octulosonate cytidylyltransferase n=1 Tax=Helicobacter turcicus TaxID=2867412 RepID=A0ABS7JL19_9HELI|nr:3-deoxy-manno-octulosonate cytidylyltransferase [Helicobacter turcicus]MBX7490097.1 3-deoxy-manno-octulosonate cytidylyltransferase [Helicobacter turcicus]MBX7544956.1 3-deoxy-manno-octulosonate cytidylyltransferase [Helicobacter turcicus]
MIIIPARLKSTRFPNKVLAQIDGIPMVIRTAQLAKQIDDVVVACDDDSIAHVCAHYKIASILTSNTHESGTDRIAECARSLKLKGSEIVINLQADEPFLEVEVIKTLKILMESKRGKTPFMGSCAKVITQSEAEDPNLVKVVLNQNNEAIYFSRSKIPYNRDNLDSITYYGHLGIYAFSMESLQEFCSLPKSTLESIEKLEQLRALENGKTIAIAKVESQSFGIDTQEDLQRALKCFHQ